MTLAHLAHMQAQAQEPAVAGEARPDSPMDMHGTNTGSDAQQSRPADLQTPGGGAEPCPARPAPVQQAAQLTGRRLKVSIYFTGLRFCS